MAGMLGETGIHRTPETGGKQGAFAMLSASRLAGMTLAWGRFARMGLGWILGLAHGIR